MSHGVAEQERLENELGRAKPCQVPMLHYMVVMRENVNRDACNKLAQIQI